MASTESEDFRQAARECMHLAAETTESEIKASYEDLAGSYQHLADKTTMWAAGIETERVILDAARTSLAVQKRAVHFSEQPLMALSAHRDLDISSLDWDEDRLRSNDPGTAVRTGAGSESIQRVATNG
jgi:hypothetical protein